MKVVTIIGARPQFIKASAISNAIMNYNKSISLKRDGIQEIIVHTGQHFHPNMSEIFFSELQMPEPNYNLGINNKTHGAMTGRMLEKIEKILLQEKPDLTLIYGDTNSTLAGALASVKLKTKIAHVEAGLRSFNRRMPEENNRVIADHCADYLFCTSKVAVSNLKKEGIINGKNGKRVFLTGDVMYDVLLKYLKNCENSSKIFSTNKLVKQHYVLVTIHRAENTDDVTNLTSILHGLEMIAATGMKVVIPIHPRTEQKVKEYGIKVNGLNFIPSVGYLDLLNLQKNAKMILTDSGGIQKEAYWLSVPCITLRKETEWTETVVSKWNRLVGSDEKRIYRSFSNTTKPKRHPNFYGDGRSANRIIAEIVRLFK